jgi:uncharacterized peroxidase-related enzyme
MARIFSSLDDDPQLSDLFKRFPHTIAPLLEYHDRLLRDPSPLTVAERELIAAYVSGLNACEFCLGAHALAARAYGIEESVLSDLLTDVGSAPIDQRFKPLLNYVGKLTRWPSRITSADAELVYAAGWDEQALFDAIGVCALFNMMNRIVLGAGIINDPRLRPAQDVKARIERMGRPGDDPHTAAHSYSRLAELWNLK